MSTGTFRPDPARTERLLRQVRAALEEIKSPLRLALHGRREAQLDTVTVQAPWIVWARLAALLETTIEPYACHVETGRLRTLTGVEPVVFSLGHQDPGHFVTEIVALLRRAGDRNAAAAASGKPCECAGSIELPPGAWAHAWWLPGDATGAGVRGWTPALPVNEGAVPVTHAVLHPSLATRVEEALAALSPRAVR